jgi:5-(carboxyamino)imidazole ribonucleotide synthase
MSQPMIAILGAGQLGRMLGLAAARMGVACRFLDPAESPPAGVVGEVVGAEFDDRKAIDVLLRGAAPLTIEFENVPAAAVEYAARSVATYPSAAALRVTQCRASEKRVFAECGVPTNRTAAWDPGSQPADELRAAIDAIGLPVVVKTQYNGYDGKFQWVLRSESDLEKFLGDTHRLPLIVEEFVPFWRELSIIGARRPGGQTAFYPLVENTHAGGILRRTVAPAPKVTPELQARAEGYARALMERLGYVGVMALELFEAGTPGSGVLLANEIAPRVHNSGHWTIEGARTSQFENHVRAILDLPLGETAAVGSCVMVNLIGVEPDRAAVLAIPGASYHWYGKAVRAGRKVGHVTVWGDDAGVVAERAAAVERLAGS